MLMKITYDLQEYTEPILKISVKCEFVWYRSIQLNMKLIFFNLLVITFVTYINGEPFTIKIDDPSSLTNVTAQNVSGSKIEIKILNQPHHLFIGRSGKKYEVLHQENIILTNDGKSHVSANIRMNIDAPVYITSVSIYDEIPNGEGGYPSYTTGGVGHNFVEFNVITNYGKGFHFFVQIRGYFKNKKSNNVNS
ncbi:hypothetical protein JTB14_002539 [Gonioctena quinquepunctata]|nr:hypothetical protein JTB14_002539 [Gonioctena quinquepunctata]